MNTEQPISVAGAGSIGCFVGGTLAAAGRPVSMLARPRLIAEIRSHGLRLTSFEGFDQCVAPSKFLLADDPAIFKDAKFVLVTVKSADTPAIADIIAEHAPRDAIVISLQNGVGNLPILRERLPDRRVLAGMVPFNVIALGEGRFHRATSGEIVVEKDAAGTAAQLSVPGLAIRDTDNIAGVQWGKLLVNLNNALNALSNLPLQRQLAQRAWRTLMADQMSEALAVMKAEGIKPVSTTPLPASLTPHLLRLPDFAFRMLLGRMMKIDPEARSSMWEDLQRGRPTEIGFLQGVITEIAERRGMNAAVSRCIVALIKNAENEGKGSPGLTPAQIRARM